jgi:hypothetical protein
MKNWRNIITERRSPKNGLAELAWEEAFVIATTPDGFHGRVNLIRGRLKVRIGNALKKAGALADTG